MLLDQPPCRSRRLESVDVHFTEFVMYIGEFQCTPVMRSSSCAPMAEARSLWMRSRYADSLFLELSWSVRRPFALFTVSPLVPCGQPPAAAAARHAANAAMLPLKSVRTGP